MRNIPSMCLRQTLEKGKTKSDKEVSVPWARYIELKLDVNVWGPLRLIAAKVWKWGKAML